MRAYAQDSVIVLQNGASGSGLFQEPGILPVTQPQNEFGQNLPQIIGLVVQSQDLTGVAPIRQESHFETSNEEWK